MPPADYKMQSAARRRQAASEGDFEVLAVRRPQADTEETRPDWPLTQSDLKAWIEDITGQSPISDSDAPEDILALGMSFLAGLSEEIDANDPDTREFMVCLWGMLQRQLYEGTYAKGKKNPIFPMEAFLAHHEAGLYPPEWVLNWLYTAFAQYLKSNGQTKIDKCLGTNRGQGGTTVFEEHKTVVMDARWMQEIATLTFLGSSVLDAATMVHGRAEANGSDCPSPETLAERYSKRGWSKVFKPFKGQLASVDEEQRRQLLALYPEHTIPDGLRQ